MSNAFDKASLVMLPHAYEEGKVYSLKPTDRSGDFTFSRGTDTATRVGEDGYIKKEYANLLEQSNTFSDAIWTTSGTLTPNQTGYDGSTDAWLYEKSAAFQQIGQTISQGGVSTFSVYLKAGSYEWVRLRISNLENAYYQLTGDGSLGTIAGGAISAKIDSVGNGWYRCSISVNSTISDVKIYPVLGDNDMGTSGSIYIQDAQLNQGLVAYPYLETTTAPVYGGLTDDMPRLDYSGGATCPSLLLEPSRTNAVAHSEYLNAILSRSDSLEINTADTQSPEGVYNASKFSFASGTRYIGPPVGTPNDVVFSVFAKAGTHNFIQFVTSATNLFAVNFDLSDGSSNVVGTAPSELRYDAEDYGNGWYRIWFYYDNAGNASTIYCWIVDSITASRASSVSTSGDIYLYGLQTEQGSYPTSYIPTYGSSQTRDGELMSVKNLQSNNILGANEGTVFVDWEGIINISNSSEVTLQTSSNVEQLRIGQDSNGAQYIADRVYGQGGIFTSSGVKRRKIAFKYSATGGLSVFEDGEKLPSTFANGDYTIDKLTINLGGVLRKAVIGFIDFFPTALSDSECIALTTV